MNDRFETDSVQPLSGFRSSLVFLGHVLLLIRFIWPVFLTLLMLIMLLGVITGFGEGWTIGNAVYYAFITAFTIGYGDLAPTHPMTKMISVVIGLLGFLFTGILVAIAVESVRWTIRGKEPLWTDRQ
ncbi:MAG: potassium channel family protein [Desulfoferrobacter sp.]